MILKSFLRSHILIILCVCVSVCVFESWAHNVPSHNKHDARLKCLQNISGHKSSINVCPTGLCGTISCWTVGPVGCKGDFINNQPSIKHASCFVWKMSQARIIYSVLWWHARRPHSKHHDFITSVNTLNALASSLRVVTEIWNMYQVITKQHILGRIYILRLVAWDSYTWIHYSLEKEVYYVRLRLNIYGTISRSTKKHSQSTVNRL